MVGSSIILSRPHALRHTRYQTTRVASLNKWRTFMFMHHRWRKFNRPPPPPPPPSSNSAKDPKSSKDQHGCNNHEQFPSFPWLNDHLKDFYHPRKTAADVYTWYAKQLKSAHMYKGFTMPSGSAFDPKRFNGWWAAYRDILERCKAQYPEAFDSESGDKDDRNINTKTTKEDELKRAEMMREAIKKRMAEKRENIRKVRSVMWEKAEKEEDDRITIREKSVNSPSDTRQVSESDATTAKAARFKDEEEDTEIDLITLKRVPKVNVEDTISSEEAKDTSPASTASPPVESASVLEKTATHMQAGEPSVNETVRDVKEPSGGKNFWRSFGRPLADVYDNFMPKDSETGKASEIKATPSNKTSTANIAEHASEDLVHGAEPTRFGAKEEQLDTRASSQDVSQTRPLEIEANLLDPKEDGPLLLKKEEMLKEKILRAEAKFKAKYANLASDLPNMDPKSAVEREEKLSSLKRKAERKQAGYDTKLIMSQLYRDAKARNRVRKFLSDENVEGNKRLNSAKENERDSGSEDSDIQDHVFKATKPEISSAPKVFTTESDSISSGPTSKREIDEAIQFQGVWPEMESSTDEKAVKSEDDTTSLSGVQDVAAAGMQTDETSTLKSAQKALKPEKEFVELPTQKLTETLDSLQQDVEAYSRALRDLEAFILKLKDDAANARTNNAQDADRTGSTLVDPASDISPKVIEVTTTSTDKVELGEGEDPKKPSQHPILRLSPSEMIAYLRYVEKSRGKLPDEEPMPPELLEYLKSQQKAKFDGCTSTTSFEDWTKNEQQQQKKQEKEKSQKSNWPMHKRAFWTGLYVAACTYAIGVGAKLVVNKPEPTVAPVAITAPTAVPAAAEAPVEVEKYSMDVKESKRSNWW